MRIPYLIILLALLSPCAFAQNMIPPQNYGGTIELKDLIRREMQYPRESLQAGEEGTVVLNFEVTKTGEVRKLRVWQSVNERLDAEAMRLGKLVLWKPGTYNEEPYDFEHALRIKFDLKTYKRYVRQRGYAEKAVPSWPMDTSSAVWNPQQVDETPEPDFKDPNLDLQHYLAQNLRYPESAYKRSITGKVKVAFVVERDGNASNIAVMQYVGGGCSEEAVRLLRKVTWKPGIVAGKAVRTLMETEVYFQLPGAAQPSAFGGSSKTMQ